MTKHAPPFLLACLLGLSPALAKDAYSGTVLGPDREPVAGVVLSLRDSYRESVRAKATVKTDAKGRFTISKAWLSEQLPDWVNSVSVIARDPKGRFAPAKGYFSRSYAGDFEREHELRLQKGVAVELQVVDEAGVPLAGARVDALDGDGWVGRSVHEPLTSDAQGRVRFGVTHLPQTYVATLAGRQAVRLTVDEDAGGKGTIKLPAGLTQQGRVLDAAGKPIANAVVGVNRGTDTIGLLAPERWLEGRLCQDAYRAHHGQDPYAGDPGGRPRDDYFGTELALAITDAEGKFTLAGLDASKRKLMALHQTQGTTVLEFTPGKDLELRLPVGTTLKGSAKLPDGSPSQGVVEAASAMGPAYRVAKVAPDGTYLVEGLVSRTYAVRLSDNEEAATAFVSVGGAPISDCVLGGGGAVRGAVAGLPSEGFMSVTLLLVSGDGKFPHAYETGVREGKSYRFAQVRPGTYQVLLFEEESKPDNLLGTVEVKAGQAEVSLDVTIPARYVAGEKERQKKNLERMGLDSSILDEIEENKAKRKAAAEAEAAKPKPDFALAEGLEKFLDGIVELEPEDRLTIEYISIKKKTLQDFRWKGLSAGPGEYGGFSLSAKPRAVGRFEHVIGFQGDFKIALTLEVLGASKRSLCALVLNKKLAVSWGQQICRAKNLKPFRGRPLGLGSLKAGESLEVVIEVKGSELTVKAGGEVVDQRSCKASELEDLGFGLVLRDARVGINDLELVGTVDRSRLPKALRKKKR